MTLEVAAGDGTYDRHDDAANQRVDDRPKRRADGHADCEINDVAASNDNREPCLGCVSPR